MRPVHSTQLEACGSIAASGLYNRSCASGRRELELRPVDPADVAAVRLPQHLHCFQLCAFLQARLPISETRPQLSCVVSVLREASSRASRPSLLSLLSRYCSSRRVII